MGISMKSSLNGLEARTVDVGGATEGHLVLVRVPSSGFTINSHKATLTYEGKSVEFVVSTDKLKRDTDGFTYPMQDGLSDATRLEDIVQNVLRAMFSLLKDEVEPKDAQSFGGLKWIDNSKRCLLIRM